MKASAEQRGAASRAGLCQRVRASWRAWLLWLVVLLLLALDWRASVPHQRFQEPMPLALGHGPAPDASHCSAAPTR